MAELEDYNGRMLPDLKMADFSGEALQRINALYGRLYSTADGFWYLAVKELCGNEMALEADIRVWDKLAQYEMKHITREFNITGTDIEALLKAIQLNPWFRHAGAKIDVESEKSATMTVSHCRVLAYLEKEGEGREKQICGIVEPRTLKIYTAYINPGIRVECLKMPPRLPGQDACCRWRFSL